jgi:hypothetical protein
MNHLTNLVAAWTRLSEEAGESFTAVMDDNKRAAWDAMDQAVADATPERVPVRSSGQPIRCPHPDHAEDDNKALPIGVLHEPLENLVQYINPREDGTYAWGEYENNWYEGATSRDQDGLPVLACGDLHAFVHEDVTMENLG